MSHAADLQPSIRDSTTIWHPPPLFFQHCPSVPPTPYEKVPLQPDQVLPGLPICLTHAQSRVPPALAPLLPMTLCPSWLSGLISCMEPALTTGNSLPHPAALTPFSHPFPGFQDPSPWVFLPWSDPSFSVFLEGPFSSPTPGGECFLALPSPLVLPTSHSPFR